MTLEREEGETRQSSVLRCEDLWVRNCVSPASSLSLATGTFSRNSLPINLHISAQELGDKREVVPGLRVGVLKSLAVSEITAHSV